jgi:hypothetical protein
MKAFREILRTIWRKLDRIKVFGCEPFYWLRTHTVDRYHLIDIGGMDGYKWGWIDRDHAMLLANMRLLCDYVEKEYDFINWKSDPRHRHAGTEIKLIYHWWKVVRPARHAEYLALSRRPSYSVRESINMASRLEEDDTSMLIRLMKVRGYLWS